MPWCGASGGFVGREGERSREWRCRHLSVDAFAIIATYGSSAICVRAYSNQQKTRLSCGKPLLMHEL